MPLFNNEAEEDVFIREEDLRDAQRFNGRKSSIFGAWALMKSSRNAETRELRAVEKKRRSLEREQRRLERVRKLRQFTSRMVTWSQ